jgi:hypothetical protein
MRGSDAGRTKRATMTRLSAHEENNDEDRVAAARRGDVPVRVASGLPSGKGATRSGDGAAERRGEECGGGGRERTVRQAETRRRLPGEASRGGIGECNAGARSTSLLRLRSNELHPWTRSGRTTCAETPR